MSRLILIALACSIAAPPAHADEIDQVKSQDLLAGKDERKRYFLLGPPAGAAPDGGYGLIVILPGGDGSAEFTPFVKRLFLNAVPAGYVVAQAVAVKWTEDQEIVWPTAGSKVEGMKFTTEEFIDAVAADAGNRLKIDPKKVFTLSWSSSGPACYSASLSSKVVTGSFVAMSVYKPDQLPPLKAAKGRPYYIYHSPDDRVCPKRMADAAAKDLAEAGALVKFVEYEGGHGWRGDVFGDVKAGLEWLDARAAKK